MLDFWSFIYQYKISIFFNYWSTNETNDETIDSYRNSIFQRNVRLSILHFTLLHLLALQRFEETISLIYYAVFIVFLPLKKRKIKWIHRKLVILTYNIPEKIKLSVYLHWVILKRLQHSLIWSGIKVGNLLWMQ